jgi:hypothetical protein
MKHIYRMYKFVKYVNSLILDYQKSYPEVADTATHYHPVMVAVQKQFGKDNRLPFNDVQDIAADVVAENWLTGDESGPVHAYCTNYNTRTLLAGFSFFRPGLLNIIIGKYGQLFTTILSLTAIVISVIALIS